MGAYERNYRVLVRVCVYMLPHTQTHRHTDTHTHTHTHTHTPTHTHTCVTHTVCVCAVSEKVIDLGT